MMTLRLFSANPPAVPMGTTWYLTDLADGEKTSMVDQAIAQAADPFTLGDLERACPGVSRDMVRRVLRDRAREVRVECLGRGPGAVATERL